jgi:MFS family permease
MRFHFHTNIHKLYAIRLLVWTHFVSAVIIPFFRDWGGLGFTGILSLNAWFMIWIFVLEAPTGTVADRFGRKASICAGCGLEAVGWLVHASYPDVSIFLIAGVLLATAFTLLSGADEALAYDTLLEANQATRSKEVMARLAIAKLIGIIVGALLGALLAVRFGVRWAFLLQAVPACLALAVAFTLKEPPAKINETRPPSFGTIMFSGLRFFFSHRILLVMALDMTVVAAVAFLIILLYQPLLERAGIPMAYFGAVHGLMALTQVGVMENFSRLEGILGGKRRLLVFSGMVTGMFFVALGVVSWSPLVIVSIALATGFGLSRDPLYSNYMNKHIPSERRATVLSTVSMMRMSAIALVNVTAGRLADWSIPSTMVLLGLFLIVFSAASRVREEYLLD